MNNSSMHNVKTFTSHELAPHTLLQRNLHYLNFLRTKIVFNSIIFCILYMLNLCKKLPKDDLRKIEKRRLFSEFLCELYIT